LHLERIGFSPVRHWTNSCFLGTNGRAFIIHQPNAPSGGKLSRIELSDFLGQGNAPEQQALLRLIGTLVDVPPFA